MKPGQIELNIFEQSILNQISLSEPLIKPIIDHLKVLSREFTGVGCFVNFVSDIKVPELKNRNIGINAHISMPNVISGLDAIVICENGEIKCLEIFTFGDEHWDGNFQGFTIDSN